MKLKLIKVSSSVLDRANLWYGSMVANRVVDIVRTQKAALVIIAPEVSYSNHACVGMEMEADCGLSTGSFAEIEVQVNKN